MTAISEAAWLAQELRDLRARITALETTPQLEHSSLTVDGTSITLPDMVRTNADARALADRAITDLADARTILEAADAALSGEISDAARTALLEEIVTAGGSLDPDVADTLWADWLVTRMLVATDRIITRDVIADGAILARHLAIAAQDALTGTTLTLTPDGLRILAAEGGDPLVALTASGLLGLHLRGGSGRVTTSVTASRVVAPVVQTDQIIVVGSDLVDEMSQRSRMVAYGYAASSALADVDWSESRLLHIGFQAKAGRVYRLGCTEMTLAAKGIPTAGTAFRTHMRVRYTLSGSAPTVSSPILWESLNGSEAPRRMTMTPNGLLMRFAADATVRLVVTAEAFDYGQNVIGGPTHFAVYEEGDPLPATGGPISAGRVANNANLGGGVVKTEYRRLYVPAWSRSYTGSGAHYQWPKDQGFLVQGLMPSSSSGITKSQWGYGLSTDGTSITSDLAGVPLADIISVRVWLDVPWTYASAGGAIRLNSHGLGADPGAASYAGVGALLGDHAVSRGYSGWAEITGTKAGWQSGAIRSLQADTRGDGAASLYTNFNPGHLEIIYRK